MGEKRRCARGVPAQNLVGKNADFKDRALFNSAKVYVDQLEHAEDFSLLRPVYSLNLVDAIFEKDVPEFIHHYQVVHEKYTDKLIEGFHIVFVELPKFKPHTIDSLRDSLMIEQHYLEGALGDVHSLQTVNIVMRAAGCRRDWRRARSVSRSGVGIRLRM